MIPRNVIAISFIKKSLVGRKDEQISNIVFMNNL